MVNGAVRSGTQILPLAAVSLPGSGQARRQRSGNSGVKHISDLHLFSRTRPHLSQQIPLQKRCFPRNDAPMYTISALYHFTRFADPAALRGPLLSFAEQHGVKGSLLLASEGINGTIAGSDAGIKAMLGYIDALPGCRGFDHKESHAVDAPFGKMKVKLKKEIVTMGQPDVDPRASVGQYCNPEEWNALISSPDVAVIDTRNDYEVAIGTFDGAIDPMTRSFGEFPAWWEKNKERFHNKRIAMFCTGGIRCEKSTNFLMGQGVEEVFHLKGGILKYLEEMPQEKSKWDGECFVFDGRVSVGHGLVEGPHDLCHACRRPILPADKARAEFENGVSCHQCVEEYDEDRKERFRERQKQVELSRDKGEAHLGRDLKAARKKAAVQKALRAEMSRNGQPDAG